MVITRFAPSPTGFLHIGSARTALFNWLFAKHMHGKFLLRIEDTDRARSTQPAVDAIINSMKWLDLGWDGEIVYQFSRAGRHAEIANQLLAEGKAYHCYETAEELQYKREAAKALGKVYKYDRKWRETSEKPPSGVKPSIRIKAPLEGETVIRDQVQGDVVIKNSELDDLVILRSDGTPTYMLAVVVDDRDMGVTHIIRGDDHLTNSARQMMIYEAMGWQVPIFAHIPLIHGADGAKLSKRHGALGVEEYRDMGYLPEALCNYILKLGWGHGDDEIISREQAIKWFDLDGIGKAAARFDFDKLNNLNGHYIRAADDERLVDLIEPILEKKFGKDAVKDALPRIENAVSFLKERAKTILELAASAEYNIKPGIKHIVRKRMQNADEIIKKIIPVITSITDWSHAEIDAKIKTFLADNNCKPGEVFPEMRVALTGHAAAPGSVYNIVLALGQKEAIERLTNYANAPISQG